MKNSIFEKFRQEIISDNLGFWTEKNPKFCPAEIFVFLMQFLLQSAPFLMTRKNWSSIWIFVDTKLINFGMMLNFSTSKGCNILMFSLHATLCACCSPKNTSPSLS